MTQVGDTSVYKYEIGEGLNIEDCRDDHIIFSNDSGNQTIDLGFIETGYAYIVDSKDGAKELGYWYVYDKTELVDLVRSAKEYEAYADYLSKASYEELVERIKDAEVVLDSEVRVKTDDEAGGFYTDFDIALEDLKNSMDNLEIDTGKLKDILDSDEIKNLDRDKYTDESLKELDEAIEKAKDALDDPDFTLEDIKNATDNVSKALDNLEEKPKQPGLDGETEIPANPKTFDNVSTAVAGIGISSAAGYALYYALKRRR